MSEHEVIEGQEKEEAQQTEARQESPETGASKQAAMEAEPVSKAPEPVAAGNEQVAILKHDIFHRYKADGTEEIGLEMAIKNQSDETLGAVYFEAVFYDIEGKVIDTVGRKECELPKDIKRTVRMVSASPLADKIKSYAVRVDRVTLTPTPTAEGNDSVEIFKHTLTIADTLSGVEFAIKNKSNVTIATMVFEARFFDIEGEVLHTASRTETDLKPGASRAVMIQYPGQHDEYKIKSYALRLVRMTTTDTEKVQVRRYEMRTIGGEVEVDGVVKNISTARVNAALVANFTNPQKENVGSTVVVMRDIEPETIRRFKFKFKPQPGDIVRTCTLTVGDLVESQT